jgi:diamine N-acetyltransferase
MNRSAVDVHVELRPLDRTNVDRMLALKVRPEQRTFVASPANSIAASLVREWGDNFEYTPMVVCAGARVIGYVTAVCDPDSTDDYWIDDIMIDADEQGKGYGRAAVCAAVRTIIARYPRCRAIRLACNRRNDAAAALYRSIGFRDTGRLDSHDHQPEFELAGSALDAHR